MKLIKRMDYLVVVLVFMLFLTPFGHAFSWIPNFYNFVNFTSINSIATYQSYAIGAVNYAYFNLSAIGINNFGYVWLQAYDASHSLIGNVTAYPYGEGLLVSLKTTSNKPYNSIALYYNQVIQQNTYYYNNYTKTNSTNYLQGINQEGFYYFYSYLNPLIVSQGSQQNVTCKFGNVSSTYNLSCSYSFKPKQPYFFYATATYPSQNVSINYIADSGLQQFNLYGSNSLLTIQGQGVFGYTTSLTQPSVTPFFAVINSTNFYLLSNSIGSYTANTLMFNSITIQPTPLAIPLNNNLAKITIANNGFPLTNFVLIPAYTTQYSNSITTYNGTPVIPNPNAVCNSAGWYCFKYRQLVQNINWSYNISTPYLANVFKTTIGANNVSFANITLTHYAEMGSSCQNVYMRDYDSVNSIDYGAVNFSILNCNPTSPTASFIIPNITKSSYTFTSFYVYWDSLNNQSNYAIPNVFNNWEFLNKSSSATIGVYGKPYLINLNTPLNINSVIENEVFGLTLVSKFGRDNLTGYHNFVSSPYETQFMITPTQINVNFRNYNFTFIQSKSLLTYKCNGGTICEVNDSNSISDALGAYGGQYYSNIVISLVSPVKATATYLYTKQYTLNVIQINPQTQITPNTLPQTIVLPNSNTSIVPNFSNGSFIGNQPAFVAQYSGLVNFVGVMIPEYYVFAIAILLIILICFFIASGNDVLTIIGLLGLWSTGILTAISGSLSLVIIALIITITYVIINAKKWFGVK